MTVTEQPGLLEAAASQFRLRHLEVVNWGTFSGHHRIDVAADGFLIVGRSGSGKSTLLDALSCLLVPPQWLAFNVAAREGERSRGDRTLASYVRGAWADQRDAESGEVAARHLRRGSTWSAVAARFADELGRQLTLVQLFWIRGTGSASADVRRHYMIADGPFDLLEAVGEFDLDLRTLKRRLDDVLHYERFAPYAERFRTEFGIGSEMALKLLHRTQSAKNLGDLNTFLREFMLDRPDSFDAADRLVGEFAELRAAHDAVVDARRQIETLAPAREADVRRRAVGAEAAEAEAALAALDVWVDGRRHALLLERLRELEAERAECERTLRERTFAMQGARERVLELETRYRSEGGNALEAIERDLATLKAGRPDLEARRERARAAAARFDLGVDDADAFAEARSRAAAVLAEADAARERAEAERDGARDALRNLETEFGEVRREVEAMERQPSNIPAQMLELRELLAEAAGIDPADLPFAGELMEVRADAAAWRGAAERLLRGFALSLLVDDALHGRLVEAVEARHLGQRLVYYRIGSVRRPDRTPAAQALCRRIEIRPGSFEPWLRAELERRFDHLCVDDLAAFRRTPRAVTRAGQVRHGADRHEKDDRHRVDDARRWVLGFDNREKLALYRERAAELGAAIATSQRRMAELAESERRRREQQESALTLQNLEFREIDLAGNLDEERRLTTRLDALRSADSVLAALARQLEDARGAETEADEALRTARLAADRNESARTEADEQARALADRMAAAEPPPADAAAALAARFEAVGAVTLATLDALRMDVERGLQARLRELDGERARLERQMERCFQAFRHDWPAEAADFDASIEAAPDFLALLDRVQADGLPRHEARFLELLRDQSSQNLAELNARLTQARKEIRERLAIVNEGLADAEFNPGTHLQIELGERNLPDVRDFRERVREVLDHAWDAQGEDAESRFEVLAGLVARLAGDDSEHRRWREQVLDVRLHVEFEGHEKDADGEVVEVYRSGAGKSGGQREKLTTTCLAAALRYQLGGLADELPRYAAVVLDEAFARADNEFTELVMRIFQRFGFQMIVATPLKSVMTLEPFIGGACFVDISDRNRSTTLGIEYDVDARRLDLPDRDADRDAERDAARSDVA